MVAARYGGCALKCLVVACQMLPSSPHAGHLTWVWPAGCRWYSKMVRQRGQRTLERVGGVHGCGGVGAIVGAADGVGPGGGGAVPYPGAGGGAPCHWAGG